MFGRGKSTRSGATARLTIIGAGGAAGYRASMSPASLQLGLEQGVDALGLNIAASSDGVLFAVFSLNLAEGTDVAKHIWAASRYRNLTLHGVTHSGWFIQDFTAEELAQLHYTEPLGRQRLKSFEHAGVEPLLTLAQTLSTIDRLASGVTLFLDCLEPSFFENAGLNYVTALTTALGDAGWRVNDGRLAIVSTEKTLLAALRSNRLGNRHFYRCDSFGTAPDELAKPDGERRSYLTELRPESISVLGQVCDGIVVPLNMVDTFVTVGSQVTPGASDASLVTRAQEAGLAVIGQTLRAENRFRPDNLKQGVDPSGVSGWESYFERVLAAGLDGVYGDQPDLILAACELARE